ncbi:MAG TPA: alpha/beta hydrolase [Thermoanaerobaculia bacterium]|nr:alpha/beta hydrolase [Thermoanaerobaculia bacterium]
MKLLRRIAFAGAAAGALYAAASYLAARKLAERLISPTGLGPTPGRSDADALRAALSREGAIVEEIRHAGSSRSPAELVAIFASPGEAPTRPTILFLHGKGGAASEWEPDAIRALRLGWNVLLPDLRGHGGSGGEFFTLGLLERDDLEALIAEAVRRFGVDAGRIGIHGCSAGSSVALQFAAGRTGLRAVWLESPFARSREMAQHYLSRATKIPKPLLWLTTEWAVARAVRRIRRELGATRDAGGIERIDPLAAAYRLQCPAALVYGGEDRLVPARFTERLAAALPPGSVVWRVPGAGHCHHDDEPVRRAREIYEARWEEFFRTNLEA